MSSNNSAQVLRNAVLERVLREKPELVEDLTRIILEMEPDDSMAAIDLETLVLHLLDDFQRRSSPRQTHVFDSDDDLVPFTSSSSDEEPKGTKGRGGIHDSNTSASSSRKIQNQDPQVADNAPGQGNKEGPAKPTYALAPVPPEAMRRWLAMTDGQSPEDVDAFDDTFLRNPPEESPPSTPDLPALESPHTETIGHGSRSSSASSSTTFYSLLPDRAAAAPASPASQQEGTTRVPKKTHRGSRGAAAAGDSAAAVETEAPTSMPLMEAVRPAEPGREDQQSARGARPAQQSTEQPASTGAQPNDEDVACATCVIGFICGVGLTICWRLCLG